MHAGAVKYLQQRYDLKTWQMRGASAGGLVATLAACNVSSDAALDLAHRLAVENGIFERPLGLAGERFTRSKTLQNPMSRLFICNRHACLSTSL